MKRWLVLLWILAPLPVLVWHFGSGQQWLARDRAHGLLSKAQAAESRHDWSEAETLYRDAATHLGPSGSSSGDKPLKARLDMALARARYRQGGAVDSIDRMDRILADQDFPKLPEDLQREARELAGRIHYYAAWVLRLEGAQRDLWMEEAEFARQNFRMLAETSLAASRTNYSLIQQTNLESAIRLERMSLTELMARPLPEEGRTMVGQGLSEQMARRRGRRGDQPGIGPQPDVKEPANGAGNERFKPGPGS
jgi:hypothetical protein